MTQPYPILHIEGDVDGDGTQETGEFHMKGNLDVTMGVRTGYLVSDAGGQINAFLGNLLGDGQSQQEGFFLNFGGGTRFWQIDFKGWSGSDLQWGDTGEGGSATDATGDPVIRQLSVFGQYLSVADLDSTGVGVLEYGEWTDDPSTDYDAANVVLEDPQLTNPSEEPTALDGTLTALSAQPTNVPLDAQEQNEY